MTKQHLIESILDFLASDSAGESKGVYHSEIIKSHLFNIFNGIIRDVYKEGKARGEFSQIDAWSKMYTVSVLGQCGSRAYCFLPFAPVQLPDGMGIRFVRSHWACPPYGAAIGAEWNFAPIEATANAIFDELEVSTMDDLPTYRLEQSNLNVGAGESSHMLWLENLPVAPDALTSIDILMVQNLQQLDDFDEIICPMGSEDMLVRQVVDLMSKKSAPDTANDMVISK